MEQENTNLNSENKKSRQHLQVSKKAVKDNKLSLNDMAVYLKIGLYKNKENKAYPSLQKLAEDTKLSIPTIRKCINNLVEIGAIKVIKDKRKNIYEFLDPEGIEMFDYAFLKNENLTAQEMAFVAKMQPNMFISKNLGVIKNTNSELSKLTGVSLSTIKRYQSMLFDKGMLNIDKDKKIYFLDELGQFILCLLKDHEDRIKNNEEEIKNLKDSIKELVKSEIQKQLKKKDNEEIIL